MDLKAFLKEKQMFNGQFLKIKISGNKVNESQKNEDGRFKQWYYYWNFCKVSSGYSGIVTLSKYKPMNTK